MTFEDTLSSASVELNDSNEQQNLYESLKGRADQTRIHNSYTPTLQTHLNDFQYVPEEEAWPRVDDYDHEQYLYHQQALKTKHRDRLQAPPPSLKKHRDQLNELFMAQEQLDKASKERYWLFKENTLLKYRLNMLQWRLQDMERMIWQLPMYQHEPGRIRRRRSTSLAQKYVVIDNDWTVPLYYASRPTPFP